MQQRLPQQRARGGCLCRGVEQEGFVAARERGDAAGAARPRNRKLGKHRTCPQTHCWKGVTQNPHCGAHTRCFTPARKPPPSRAPVQGGRQDLWLATAVRDSPMPTLCARAGAHPDLCGKNEQTGRHVVRGAKVGAGGEASRQVGLVTTMEDFGQAAGSNICPLFELRGAARATEKTISKKGVY